MADTTVSQWTTGSGATVSIIAAPGTGTGLIVGEIKFFNGNSSPSVVTVYRLTNTNKIQTFTIPAGGMASYENERWSLAVSENAYANLPTGVNSYCSGDALS